MLLHPTSLPGPWEAGVLGADARRFIDWLAAGGFGLWQMLPIGPVGEALSPYQSASAFAGDARLIDTVDLHARRWLADALPAGAGNWAQRRGLLREAWAGFCASGTDDERAEYTRYWQAQRDWLLPFALYRVARQRFGDQGWWTWPDDIRRREAGAIAQLLVDATAGLREIVFEQWSFDRQWQALRSYAAGKGIQLVGDLPIYVDLDSADAWWHRALFCIDETGQPQGVSGVPPDYFSAEGQRWGNPLYDWEAMRRTGFRWWTDRVRTQLRRFDYLRIDHFRGLQAYWEIAGNASSGREGFWRLAPGRELLEALRAASGGQPFLAEDLGSITPEVHELRTAFDMPGMLIAQFAFDGTPDNPYLPKNQQERAVLYTGTHDNNTVIGWSAGLDADERERVCRELGCAPEGIAQALLRSVWHSRPEIAVFPLQDLLGLGAEARMNTPGSITGNWTWRFDWSDVPPGLAGQCRQWAEEAGRYRPPESCP